jgi:NAD(P)-dependent dehydrogenase (short-subunit alcohol dehydrogenase family)
MTHELAGKNFIVTGGNSGIGMVAARELAQRGARVIIASRSADKTLPVIEDIKRATGNDQVEFAKLDLSDLDSVRACGEALLAKGITFDVLINTAGFASGVRGARGLTKQGYELTFGTNHLGHYLLTRQLLDRITGRVVNVSSVSHYQTRSWQWERLRQPTRSFAGLGEYAISKLANVLFTEELAKRWSGKTYAVHPGTVATDVWRGVPNPLRWLMKKGMRMITPEQGAVSMLKAATAPELANETGLYYDEKGNQRKASRLAHDEQLQKDLWARSAEWVGLPA